MSDWHYLQFKEGTWGNISIITDGHLQVLTSPEDDSYWFSNGEQCDLGIGGQRCMYYKGTGKVLTTLGMGILPLLLALKDDVTEVVCYENDKDKIDAFNAQDFDKSKITIVNDDLRNITNIDEYDSILLDAYPLQVEFRGKFMKQLVGKVFICQAWESLYNDWLGIEKEGEHTIDNFNEYACLVMMPTLTEEEFNDYFFNYYAKDQKLQRRWSRLDSKDPARADFYNDGQLPSDLTGYVFTPPWSETQASGDWIIDEHINCRLKIIDERRIK
jgi:hypothetical protein